MTPTKLSQSFRQSRLMQLVGQLVDHPMFFSFYFPTLMIAIGVGVLSPIVPLFVQELGGSYGMVGLVLAAPLLGNLLADLPAGLLLRWWGHRRSMVLGMLLSVVMTVLCYWVQGIGQAFWLRLGSGIGTAVYSVARHAYVTDRIRTGSRGRAIAAFGGVNRLGRFVGPMLGGAIGAAFGLRATFLVFGLLGGFSIIAVIMTAVPVTQGPTKIPDRIRAPYSMLELVRQRIKLLLPGGVGQLFAQMIRSGRTAIIPLYAADVVGLSVDSIGWLLGITAFVEMTLFYPAGWIMDHWGRKFAIVPSFLIQAVAMALVPLSSTFVTLLLCVSAIGAGNGLSSGAMMTLGADLSPRSGRGEFLGIWRFIGDIGGSGGPYLVGQVADALALPAAALVMAAAGLAAAGIFALLLPETNKMRETA
ncbi:MAG: MFS transporter [Anaerolineae bacterium]|nr:MFS transporter [Anaerolineae bacterium]